MAHTKRLNMLSRRASRLAFILTLAIFAGWALLPERLFSRLSPTAQAASIVVTNTNDSGAGSLRAAILNANNNGNATIDTITFNIPGSGVHTIKPLTELPAISTQTVIDGYSQPGSSVNTLDVGNNAVLLIEIDGSMIPSNTSAYGLVVSASACTIKGLVINNFGDGDGIDLKGSDSHIRGNFIGTDPTGAIARPNYNGISVSGSNCDIGWTTPADRNLISGNNSSGLIIGNTQGNKVFGNYIGTNAAGTQALGNSFRGMDVFGTGHTIGNTTVVMRNVISGNGDSGIEVSGSGHKFQNNYVGVNATATAVLGNKKEGINVYGASDTVVGGTSSGSANIIAGNGDHAISIGSSLNVTAQNVTVQGNFIGTNTGGSLDMGNAGAGVNLRSNLSGGKIGGAGASEANLIAFNDGGGIVASASSGSVSSTFSANKIYSNEGLGIDLFVGITPDGVTPNDVNDGDGGVNGRQNFPVLTSAQNTGGITSITGTLNSGTNAQYNIEFFVSTGCDASGYGEGRTYLGSTTATTVGNDVTFSKAFAGFHVGQFITATATSPSGNTSEFSKCVQVIDPNAPPTISVNDISFAEGSAQGFTTQATFTVTLSKTSAQTVSVKYATQAGTATSAIDYQFTGATLLTFAPGETSKNVTILVNGDTYQEPDETFFLILSEPTNATFADNEGKATIQNDDAAPTLAITDVSAAEGDAGSNTNFTFTVTLSYSSAQERWVHYTTTDGTAAAGADYQSQTGTLVFSAGQTQKTITVPVSGDATQEPDETFFVNLSNASHATIADGQGIGTIKNDDAPPPPPQPVVELNSASYTVSEGAGRLDLQVTRAGDASGAVAVSFATTDGNAGQKADFNVAVGTLKFAAGETSRTVSIFITDDAYVEGGETFTFTLSNPVGATLGANASAIVMIEDNDASAQAANPIDTAEFFVRQHYVDFLNREPEPAGYQGWLNVLSNCPASGKDSNGNYCDRVEVSADFFRSEEFQVRGYFVYRFYEAALGRSPKYIEFMADLRRVTGFLSDQQLETEKADFVKDFMATQEFKQKYDPIADAAAYVDALSMTAGVTLANRDELVQALQSNQKTRGEVLRAVAESPEVGGKFFNKAFVLMQYFGYLRRDADILYLQWVEVLNQTGDYRVMVSGFLNSIEYRQRFNQ